MKNFFFTSEFSIYNMGRENLYVAIPKAFAKIIREYAAEYKGLKTVPADKYVKGIELIDIGRNNYKFKNDFGVEREIPINQLSFGNF